MTKIHKLVTEVQHLAQERGHTPTKVRYAGRSLKSRGTYADIVCETCSALAIVRSKPYNDECDIEGTLTKTDCNVATFIPRACPNLLPQ